MQARHFKYVTDNDSLKSITFLQDFYTMSTCRDMLFHVHEMQFNLTHIEEILKDLQLEFIGFDFSVLSIKERFKLLFPDDEFMTSLQNWYQYEQKYPDTFKGMYQFWVKKSPQ